MRVLVTGIDGYLGNILAYTLVTGGFEVVGLDTGFYSGRTLYKHPLQEMDIRVIHKDIRRVTKEDLEGIEAVAHLGELSNDPLGNRFVDATYSINYNGTVRLAEMVKTAGIRRFVYFSSCSVYGASDDIADERSPVNPLTPYAKCKVLNEQRLAELADGTFSPVYLRNATAFGASPSMRFDIAVNNLTGRAWVNKEIKMDSDGSPWRPFVHARDIARAVVCCLDAPLEAVHNVIFNVGGNKANYQIREVAEIIGKHMPDCAISFNRDAVDKRNYRVDFTKINTTLPNFAADLTVEDGAKELLAIFKDINLSKDVFEAKEFTRLSQLEHLVNSSRVDKDLFWADKDQ